MSIPSETILVLLALGAFGLLHSLMAALGFKARMEVWMGERAYLGLYRLVYNVISTLIFLPVLALIVLRPGPVIWRVEGVFAVIFVAIQAIGLIGLLASTLQIDGWRFAGMRQAIAYVSGDPLPLPPESLSQGGVYALVRHPLYLFTLLVLWPLPVMHAASLGLAIGATIYFVIGARLEERKLAREFGPTYIAYRHRVPYMIPFLHCFFCPD